MKNLACASQSDHRLISSLHEAWTVENNLIRILDRQAQQSRNAEASRLYWDHADVTRAQKDRLEQRLGELGQQPESSPGGFARSLSALCRGGLWPLDLMERESQMIRASYSMAQLECAMYRTIEGQALRDGDTATLALAQEALREEEAHARRLWPYVGLFHQIAKGAPKVRALLA
jgi:ferritin-like metal-binding protein YciE